uniref:Galectin n=1 Tax=Meloidogyne incognita TaxID=6306 RepID=A0A914LUN3_MELIC
MKSKTLLLLIICASFMVTIIETTMCSNTPIIYKNLKVPSTIDLVKVGFGKGFLPGKYIEINGVVLERTIAFDVYLMGDGVLYRTANIPFAFSYHHYTAPPGPRVELNNETQLNDITNPRKWGQTERYRLHFKKGQPFILELVAAPHNTIIKIPSIINLVEQGFEIGFTNYKFIVIHGTPIKPTRFDISLAKEGVPEETADIPFHFSADFTKKKAICDTWKRGEGWTRKETLGGFPFTVGQSFELEFRAMEYLNRNMRYINIFGIHIYVNKQPKLIVSFNRYDLSNITQLEIKGAIEVSYVTLCP